MIIYKRIILYFAFSLFLVKSYGQNRPLAELMIKSLCSEDFAGRGYINQGDLKSAGFIAETFNEIGLEKLGGDYFHHFNLDVNTIPVAKIFMDSNELKPGYDFLVSPSSGSEKGRHKVFYVSKRMLESPKADKKVKKAIRRCYVPVIATYDKTNKTAAANIENIKKLAQDKTIIFLKESLLWSVGRKQNKGCEIWMVDSIFNRYTEFINLDIKAEFINNYKSQNVLGYVEGTQSPDSFIVFCGHYDHLGKMGDATFYGANDNASGIAMLIDMAYYFVNNPQRYSIAFIAFGGEEAGLVGSYNHVKNPPGGMPLSKTKFVFNMDLMGSGEDGATIVNGSIYKEEFNALTQINDSLNYLKKIKSRGKAANSDHYFFSEAGVPSFFIYLMGEYKHYHIPSDNPDNLELGEYYDRSYLLIRDFILYLNQ
jgi:aminopeptidase YwaD